MYTEVAVAFLDFWKHSFNVLPFLQGFLQIHKMVNTIDDLLN